MDRRLLPYYLLVSVAMMAMGGIFTLLGELRDELGFSESGLGFMVAMGFFTAFAAQIGLSRFADRGHSALMVRAGLIAVGAGISLMAVADDLWHFVLLRMVIGLGIGSLVPSLRRLVVVSDPERVGKNLGAMGAFDVAGFLIGPILSAVVASLFGFRAPFVCLGLLTAAFLPLVARLPRDVGATSTERRVVSGLLKEPAVRAMLVSAVGWFAMIGVFESVWAVMLTDYGAETWFIGLTMSLIMVPMLVIAPLAGGWAQRFGPLRLAMLGVLIVSPLFMSYGFVTNLTIITVLATLQGIGDAMVLPSTQVGVAVAAPPELAASAQGLQGATLELTAGVSALLAGVIYEHFGPATLFVSFGVLMLLGVAAAGLLSRRLPHDHAVLRPNAQPTGVPTPAT